MITDGMVQKLGPLMEVHPNLFQKRSGCSHEWGLRLLRLVLDIRWGRAGWIQQQLFDVAPTFRCDHQRLSQFLATYA